MTIEMTENVELPIMFPEEIKTQNVRLAKFNVKPMN